MVADEKSSGHTSSEGYIKKAKASRKVLQEVEAKEVKRRRQGRESNAPTLSGTPSGTKEEAEAEDEE